MEEALIEGGESNISGLETGAAPALIAVHPGENSVAVAVGSELRVFDLKGDCPITLVDNSNGPSHSDSIRDITFNTKGEIFASAGDDKLVKIWKTDSWHCIRTVNSEKRVSGVAISHEGNFVIFADKFGVVWLISLNGDDAMIENKPVPILGHYCSIITSMKFSPDGKFIATADRDFKIRITVFPTNPLNGAHEIQSFCLGHTDFVSCVAFVHSSDHNQSFLLSGSGDSTVRLWDYVNGCLLNTCFVGNKVGEMNESETEEETHNFAVTDICASPNGSLIAIATQSLNGVMLMNCDFSTKTLSFSKVITIEKSYIPTSLALGLCNKNIWTITGASNLPNSANNPLLTRIKIISFFKKDDPNSDHQDPVVLEDSKVPGGEKLLVELQGSADAADHEAALMSAAAAVRVSLQNMLIKKNYSVERRESRKRNRNDKKIKK